MVIDWLRLLLAIRFATSSGYRWLRTFHHPDNASAIGMNRRLGFVDEDARMWSAGPRLRYS